MINTILCMGRDGRTMYLKWVTEDKVDVACSYLPPEWREREKKEDTRTRFLG
jgi:hypothetical protein